MICDLEDDYRAIYSSALEFARSTSDIAEEADSSDGIHAEMRQRLAESGFCRVMVPARYGGRDESIDPLAATLVREAFSRYSSHLDSMFAMQGIGSFALTHAPEERLCEYWLPRVSTLEAIAGFALTEPQVGSDLKGLRTTIDADGAELEVSGRKSFITNAPDASYYLVFGKEDGAFSLVLVPANTPGVVAVRGNQIISPHVLGDVGLERVRLPIGHRVGAPGQGFPLVLATLGTFRVSVAGEALGIGRAALDLALEHTGTRTVSGSPLSSLGTVSSALAMCWTELEVARSITYRAARAAGRDPLNALDLSSMAKIASTEACARIVDRCVQLLGRFGVVSGSKIERLYRAARPTRIYEGPTEVLLDALGRKLVRRGLSDGAAR